MWSLPDIKQLNAVAASETADLDNALETGYYHGEQIECQCKDWGINSCGGQVVYYLWFDIFSDDPKGVLGLCEHHSEYTGDPVEGFFTCCYCGRVMIENYTWEKYSTWVDSYEEYMCLPCALSLYIREPENWIELTDENIAKIDFEQFRHSPHLIGSEMPVPDAIKFFDNAEFDSMDGHQISGDTIQVILTRAMDAGYSKVLLILDSAYQFAISIGIYVEGNQNG